ncbi:hypothetical protein, partial [Escherichia coli]|uniref:hypothetical protein n=1 Tax=Escherichia coli TaxID=562 RepID=UPI0010CB605E
SVAYGDINKTADANVKQQYLELRSEGAKTFEPREGLNVETYPEVTLRQQREGAAVERAAGKRRQRRISLTVMEVDCRDASTKSGLHAGSRGGGRGGGGGGGG